MALSDVQQMVDDMVRDDAGLIGMSARDDAIMSAVNAYSLARPRILVEDVVADGTDMLPLPAEWGDVAMSRVIRLTSPLGAPYPRIWEHARTPVAQGGGMAIRLLDRLAAGTDVRVEYKTAHRLDAAADTVPVSEREAVASYAAYLLLDQLANRHAGDSDATIQSDSVDHASKSRDYAARARAALERYRRVVAASAETSRAAAAVVGLDRANSLGRRRLFHGGRR